MGAGRYGELLKNFTGGLSVVIPTAKYNEYFDRAVASAIQNCPDDTEIIVNVNGESVHTHESSNFFSDSRVSWHCTGSKLPMHESWNKAVEASKGSWLFLLSDDDLINPGFFDDPEAQIISSRSLYAVNHNVINVEDEVVGESQFPIEDTLRGGSVFHAFLAGRFRHNLSLFVFPRCLWEEIGGYEDCGYPNGYYVDTVFHGKLLVRAENVYCEHRKVFSRRESSFQASQIFYIGPKVNFYLKTVARRLWTDKKFRERLPKKRFPSLNSYRAQIAFERFMTEWRKSLNPNYDKGRKFRIALLLSFLFFWRVPLRKKRTALQRVFFPKGVGPWIRSLFLSPFRIVVSFLAGVPAIRQIVEAEFGLREKLELARKKAHATAVDQFSSDRMQELRGSQAGRCFIIGNGPSLSAADLELIRDYPSFGANKISLIFPETNWRPTFFSLIDPMLWESIGQELADHYREVFTHSGLDLSLAKIRCTTIPRRSDEKFVGSYRFSSDATLGFYNTLSVTLFNMQLAAHMGFQEIILLGVDHNYSGEPLDNIYQHSGQTNHFTSNYRVEGEKVIRAGLAQMTWGYVQASRACEELGIRLINATRGGNLEAFTRASLEDVLSDSGRIPTI